MGELAKLVHIFPMTVGFMGTITIVNGGINQLFTRGASCMKHTCSKFSRFKYVVAGSFWSKWAAHDILLDTIQLIVVCPTEALGMITMTALWVSDGFWPIPIYPICCRKKGKSADSKPHFPHSSNHYSNLGFTPVSDMPRSHQLLVISHLKPHDKPVFNVPPIKLGVS